MSQQEQTSPSSSASSSASGASSSAAAAASASAPPTKPSPPAPNSWSRLAIPLFAVLVAFAFIAVATLRWDAWVGNAATQTTNDAYIRAEMTRLSSRVAGEILNVAATDFQRVKAGDLLIQIDPADYQAQVAQTEASVVAAQAALDNLNNQVELQYATIAQAEAQQVSAAALEVEARQEQERQQSLSQTESGTRQRFEQATAALAKAQADVRASRAVIAAQRHQLEVLAGTKKQRSADVLGAQAALASARLKLGYTRIVAPFDGVGERRFNRAIINIGNLINAAAERLCDGELRKRSHARQASQSVDITVDSFRAKIAGRVERVPPASGSQFALLPPTTPPAISPRSFSAFRSGSCSTRTSRCWSACCRECLLSPTSTPTLRGRMAENDSGGVAAVRTDQALDPISRGGIAPQPLFAVGAVLLGSFLANFDSRLTSVGLADLRGAFSLGFDEGAWLSTAGIGSQIFIAPAVAWLATVFGLRRVLGIPSLVYAVVSLVIPFVHDYTTLIVLSIVHGMLLGTFVPATLMIVLRNLPIRWWVPAIAIYSIRVGFALDTSPSLVGFYVENWGWQWLYWQGVAIAPLMGLMVYLGTPAEPVNRSLLRNADWGGMLLLGTAVSMIYAGLDQGNRLDWLESGTVMALLLSGGALFVLFLINEALVPRPWAHVNVLFSRNVGLSLVVILLYTLASLSNSSLVPNFLVAVGQLRPEQSGVLLLTCGALPMFVLVPISIFLLRHFDARTVLILGLSAFASANLLGTQPALRLGGRFRHHRDAAIGRTGIYPAADYHSLCRMSIRRARHRSPPISRSCGSAGRKSGWH